MKRRQWLIGTAGIAAGVLVVGAAGLAVRKSHFADLAASRAGTEDAPLLAGWVKVGADGLVTVLVPHCDMGQGSLTALAMMVAEELDVPWAQVRAEQAPADAAFANRFFIEGFLLDGKNLPDMAHGAKDLAFGEISRLANIQITGGSGAVRFTGQIGMRSAGAAARQMLVQAAANRLGVAATELTTEAGIVVHAASGRSLPYGQLVADAARLDVPTQPKLKPRSEFRLVGQAPPRLDIPDKVTGATKYGIDAQVPGMLVATVMAAPVHGELLLDVDEAPAMAVRGVHKVVRMPHAVAVVADSYWTARTGLQLLKPTFSATDRSQTSSDSISRAYAQALATGEGKKLKSAGNTQSATGDLVSAVYEVPFLHHAAMEPINSTVMWDGQNLKAWGSEQDALGARANLAEAAGVAMERVEFVPMSLGGGFGRRSAPKKEHLRQAVAIAKACTPAPVKLIWSREEDFAQGAYRPCVATRIEARIGTGARLQSWHQRFIDTPELLNEGYPIPYGVPNLWLGSVPSANHVRYGAWRSVAHSQHGFFTESFMDELAVAAKQDPYAFRRDHLPEGSRHRRVLEEAARLSGWTQPLPPGRGRGIAMVESFGSVVAEVIEVSVSGAGEVQVHKVTAVVDCGYVVHADTARQQVEGAIIMGLSSALNEAITVERGAVVQRNFSDYPVLKMAQVPAIHISFVESNGPLGGLGEVGLPPAAPALANAIHAATGVRVRSLPIRLAAPPAA